MRIRTYKNVDEKERAVSWRRKNVQERTKADEKRILCKSTLILLHGFVETKKIPPGLLPLQHKCKRVHFAFYRKSLSSKIYLFR